MLPFLRENKLTCVNASQHVRCDNAFINKVAYTVVIIVTKQDKHQQAFVVVRNKNHLLQNHYCFISKLQNYPKYSPSIIMHCPLHLVNS